MDRDPLTILLSSSFSTLFSTALTNPIEVRKLNQQFIPVACPAYPQKCIHLQITTPLSDRVGDTTFLEDCICKTKVFGRNMFNGLSVVLPQFLFSNIVFMQLYEYQKQRFLASEWGKKYSNLSTVIAAVSSRTVVSLVTAPLEAKRVRMSNQVTDTKMASLTMAENLSSIKVTLTRDIVFSMMYWGMIQSIRNKITGGEYRTQSKNQLQIFVQNAVPGMIGGGIVSLVTCPLDTVKTRVQTQSLVCKSITRQILSIFNAEGLSGLFLGYKYRVLKSLTHSSLYLVFYESFLDMAQKMRSHH